MVYWFVSTSSPTPPPAADAVADGLAGVSLDEQKSQSSSSSSKKQKPKNHQLYMGLDKFENEDLIKFGQPHDVWFHVDDMSSAHVYLRLNEGLTIDTIPADLLADCAQLVKANSIEGCKKKDVPIVYTLWGNLNKTNSMKTGQIGFHKMKKLKHTIVREKDNAIINRLNKTKTERSTKEFIADKYEYDRQILAKEKVAKEEARQAAEAAKKAQAEAAELRSYSSIMVEDNMTSNANITQSVEDFEDDFM